MSEEEEGMYNAEKYGQNVGFEHIRRITGYLVGDGGPLE